MSILSVLSAALETGLAGITTANGYNTDTATVFNVPTDLTNLGPESLPALIVIPHGDEEKEIEDDTNVRWNAPVLIEGFVRLGESTVETELDNFIADVKKYLWALDTLGSNFMALLYDDAKRYKHRDQVGYIGRFSIEAAIVYYTTKETF